MKCTNYIDISDQLSNLVPLFVEELILLYETERNIFIRNGTGNEMDYSIIDFSLFSSAESIEIGNHCFRSVHTFRIDGLNRLKTIKVGKSSFTQNIHRGGKDNSKSFHILNCKSLESIQIGDYSFSDFGGDFELKNLPQLQSIHIGSHNFHNSSFVIRGIDMILNI